MAVEIEDVFKNDNGAKITKVINDDNEAVLVESFINDSNEMEYNIYSFKDGGNVELTSEEDEDYSDEETDDDDDDCNVSPSIKTLYDKALNSIIEDL